MSTSLPRSKVKKNQTWNSESVFATPNDFDAAVKKLVEAFQISKNIRDASPKALIFSSKP
jgi:hypothetical protein